MEYRHTRHQVARGARPDAETFDRLFLIKRSSVLHATYQIRLLTFLAARQGKKLVIEVRKDCKIHDGLREFAKQHSATVKLVRE